MENTYEYSYVKYLTELGFTKIEVSNEFPQGGYINCLDKNQIIVIYINISDWTVKVFRNCEQTVSNLEALILSKSEFSSVEERNEDVYNSSVKQLNAVFAKLNIDQKPSR